MPLRDVFNSFQLTNRLEEFGDEIEVWGALLGTAKTISYCKNIKHIPETAFFYAQVHSNSKYFPVILVKKTPPLFTSTPSTPKSM